MLHLCDANVLITASNTYYPLDQIPEFWAWIVHQGTIGNFKLPLEILEEVLAGGKNDDPLLDWMKTNKDVLLLAESVDATIVQTVVNTGYAPDLTDDEVEEIGRGPFLIAYALASTNHCVVTTETSSPGKKRQNKKSRTSATSSVSPATIPSPSIERSASAPDGTQKHWCAPMFTRAHSILTPHSPINIINAKLMPKHDHAA